MNAALFRRLACRPAAFLAVWGGQTEREAPLADFKLHALSRLTRGAEEVPFS